MSMTTDSSATEFPDLEVEIVEMGEPVESAAAESTAVADPSPVTETKVPVEESAPEVKLPRGRHEAPAPGELPKKPEVTEKETSVADELQESGDSVQDAIDWINAMLNRSDDESAGSK